MILTRGSTCLRDSPSVFLFIIIVVYFIFFDLTASSFLKLYDQTFVLIMVELIFIVGVGNVDDIYNLTLYSFVDFVKSRFSCSSSPNSCSLGF